MINLAVMFFITGSFLFPSCKNFTPEDEGFQSTFANPLYNGADPWIIKKDNLYYYCFSSGNSINISRSAYLTKKGETRKIWSAPASGWNRSNIWAPELHFFEGNWYIYYAGGESGPPFIHQKTGVLRSENGDPFSKYTDMGMLYTGENPDMLNDNRWAIDMTVFKHGNTLYAVWSGWIEDAITDKTPQHLFIAEMANPYTMKGTRKMISSPDQPWETGGSLDLEEGPEVLEHNGDLFIVYSCRESWTISYRLGLLRLKDKDASVLIGSNWQKSGPVFQGPLGTGHCSFTTSPDDTEDWIIYHSKKSAVEGWQREIRLQQFKWKEDGSPDFGIPVETGVQIKRPSGEVEIEKRSVSK